MEMYIIKYHCTVSLLEDPPNKLASSAACIQDVHTGIINVEFSRVMLLGEMGTNCQCIYTNFITSNSRLLLVNVAPSRPIAKVGLVPTFEETFSNFTNPEKLYMNAMK